MKESNILQSQIQTISVIQILSDLLMIVGGGLAACLIVDVNDSIALKSVFFLILAFYFTVASISDLYRSWRTIKSSVEIQIVLKVWFISALLCWALIKLATLVTFGSFFYLVWFAATATGLIASRAGIKFGVRYIRTKGYNIENIAFVGMGRVGCSLVASFQHAKWTGFNILGYYDNIDHVGTTAVPKLGTIEQLFIDAKKGNIDRVYIALPIEEMALITKIITELSDSTCSVMLTYDSMTMGFMRSELEDVNDVPVLSIFDTPLTGINRYIKRAEDIIISTLIILLISPILLLVAASIKLTSPGPIIFKQKRYGMNGKTISVWKFRSMKVEEEGTAVAQATKNDSRVTSVGKFIRRTSLDELPQFINVLMGDMSIVGPRPHAVIHNEQYRKMIKGYMLRHKVKPGISGLAQIKGWRGETDTIEKMEKRVECDLEYIRNWSLWLDLKIIFISIFKGFVNKAAY